MVGIFPRSEVLAVGVTCQISEDELPPAHPNAYICYPSNRREAATIRQIGEKLAVTVNGQGWLMARARPPVPGGDWTVERSSNE